MKTPFEQIQTYTIQLERLQVTSEMLRRVLRFLYLSKRLEMQMPGGDLELTKAALTLSEVGTVKEISLRICEAAHNDSETNDVRVDIHDYRLASSGIRLGRNQRRG